MSFSWVHKIPFIFIGFCHFQGCAWWQETLQTLVLLSRRRSRVGAASWGILHHCPSALAPLWLVLLPKSDIWSRFSLLLTTNPGRSWVVHLGILPMEVFPLWFSSWNFLQHLHKLVHMLVIFEWVWGQLKQSLRRLYSSFLARGSCS